MKTLNEIFDKSYPINKDLSYDGFTHKIFQSDKGHNYTTVIRNYNDAKKANLCFDMSHKDNVNPDYASDKIENNEGNQSHKVFSTVKNILKNHLKKYPHINHIEFSSDNDEPSRIKLYHSFARHLDPNYSHKRSSLGYTHFNVNVNNLKENLNEIFDKSYPVNISHKDTLMKAKTEGKFETKNNSNINVKISHSKKIKNAHLSFTHGEGAHFGLGYTDPSKIENSSAPKVFSTVKKVIKSHLQKYPEVKKISFSAYGESRVRLYHHLAKMIDPNYEHEEILPKNQAAVFTLNPNNLKESFDPMELQ